MHKAVEMGILTVLEAWGGGAGAGVWAKVSQHPPRSLAD